MDLYSKEKKKGKSLRFKGQEEDENQATKMFAKLHETLREEINIKLQTIIEEIQNTVSLRDFEKKCLYFEEKINTLKAVIPQVNPTYSLPPKHNDQYREADQKDQTKSIEERLSKTESIVKRLKGNIEQLLNMMESDRMKVNKVFDRENIYQLNQNTKLAHNSDFQDIRPSSSQIVNHQSISNQGENILFDTHPYINRTQPIANMLSNNNVLNMGEIDNIEMMVSSNETVREKSLKEEKKQQKKKQKVSSSTGKLQHGAGRGSKSKKEQKALRLNSPPVKEKTHISDLNINNNLETNKYRSTKDKIRSLLGKSTTIKRQV